MATARPLDPFLSGAAVRASSSASPPDALTERIPPMPDTISLDVDKTPLYRRQDIYDEPTTEHLAAGVRDLLTTLGEDPDREGLLDTPTRVAKAHQFLTHGYRMDPEAILRKALFAEEYSEMILVKDIEVYSQCEHHMLPFFGKAHVAYIPNGHIVGLSKIPRVVDVFARRLQVQERLTIQIRDVIQKVLNPLGVGVVIEAQHMCMMMRGAEKQNSSTTTSAMSGEFQKHTTRAEFMRLIHK
jgi:GTP cyclohydrolase I